MSLLRGAPNVEFDDSSVIILPPVVAGKGWIAGGLVAKKSGTVVSKIIYSMVSYGKSPFLADK